MTGEFRFHENPDTSSKRALSYLGEGRPEDHDEVPFTSVDGSKRRAEGRLSQATNLDKRKLCAIGQQSVSKENSGQETRVKPRHHASVQPEEAF
ncbi:unnamed protein product [Caenorhabditis nigoni]